MTTTFKVGTRTSRLAMRQTELIIGMLRARVPGVEFQVVPIVTQGDRDRTSSLHVIGGKGVFVKEIEETLVDEHGPFIVERLFLTDGRLAAKMKARVQTIESGDIFLPTLEDDPVIINAIRERLAQRTQAAIELPH